MFCACLTTLSSYAQSGSSESGKTKGDEVISWWSFNEERENIVFDEVQQEKGTIYGKFEYVPGIYGNAIKLDGFRTYIKSNSDELRSLSDAFTVESWVALASYPWSWAPVIDGSYEKMNGFFLGIDPEGHVGFKLGVGSSWFEITSEMKIPLRKWAHIAAVFEPDQKISLFINGKEAAAASVKGNFVPVPWNSSLTIGRNNGAQKWAEAQLTTESTYFFLDGILDEMKITGRAKTEGELNDLYISQKTLPAPALSSRKKLPVGPVGSGSFGAFYTKLEYYKEWDDLWRVSDIPDIFVRFDQSPVQLIFWRGASFNPCWVTENGIWYTNEWLETWGDDVQSCAEPIMDRQCRYSHVRLIENTEARVVIHWRYALSDAFNDFVAVTDDGRGEWCDEFHIIYPDQVGVRKMELHYSHPERKHDWVEQIIVLPPGKYPNDVIEKESISLVNMLGEVQKYSWDDDLEIEMPEPEKANMSFVNLKSKYRPFFILPPDPVETVEGTWASPFFRTYASNMARPGYRPNPAPSAYGWWDHWPVAQVPGDGRWVTTPDRPSHFNLTTFVQWKDYEYTERKRTRIMLTGMTDKNADELVPLANSWLQAPNMKITADGYKGGSFDQSERAYIIEKTEPGNLAPISFVLEASKDSPLVNPAIIIESWGSQLSALMVNDKIIEQGKDFRQGIRKGPDGEDLILWIRLDSQKPVNIALERQGSR